VQWSLYKKLYCTCNQARTAWIKVEEYRMFCPSLIGCFDCFARVWWDVLSLLISSVLFNFIPYSFLFQMKLDAFKE
jgi:hypothetical protein